MGKPQWSYHDASVAVRVQQVDVGIHRNVHIWASMETLHIALWMQRDREKKTTSAKEIYEIWYLDTRFPYILQ